MSRGAVLADAPDTLTAQVIINDSNVQLGNRAMASALLLYYHLASEGRFSHAETVFIDPEHFEGFRFLDVEVEDQASVDIDQTLLREAAVIYVLCDVNDMLSEHEDRFRSTPVVERFVATHEAGKLAAVPETAEIVALLRAPEAEFDFPTYLDILARIYDKYVRDTFERLARSGVS